MSNTLLFTLTPEDATYYNIHTPFTANLAGVNEQGTLVIL